MTRFERTIIAAFALNAVDVVLTVLLVTNFNMIEFNPIMARALACHPMAFAAIKLGAVAVICLAMKRRHDKDPESACFGVGVVVGMMSMICLWQAGLLIWALTGCGAV